MKTKKLSFEDFKENQIGRNQKRSISGGDFQYIHGKLVWVEDPISPNGGGSTGGDAGAGIPGVTPVMVPGQ